MNEIISSYQDLKNRFSIPYQDSISYWAPNFCVRSDLLSAYPSYTYYTKENHSYSFDDVGLGGFDFDAEQYGITLDDIDYVVCHQANERIIDAVVKRMDIPEEKVVKVIARYGNTSAASIPITLDEMYEQGMLKKGNRILLATFGAGFTWASMIVEI